MPWTNEQKVRALLHLPWTVEPSTEDGVLIVRVKELPSVIATGATEEELERDYWESLQATLEVYVGHDDPIPLPPRVANLPWENVARPRFNFIGVINSKRGDAFNVEKASANTGAVAPFSTTRVA